MRSMRGRGGIFAGGGAKLSSLHVRQHHISAMTMEQLSHTNTRDVAAFELHVDTAQAARRVAIGT